MHSPIRFFAYPALIMLLIGMSILGIGILQGSFIFNSIGVMTIISACLCFSWGLVAELVYRTGDFSRAEMARLTFERF